MLSKLIILSIFILGISENKGFAQNPKDTSNTVIVDPVMPVAEFPGGDKALMKFIRQHLHRVKGAEGKRLFITFIVEKDGNLTHFDIIRGINKEANTEALRVMKLSPKWRPVIYKGKREAAYFTVPIAFPK